MKRPFEFDLADCLGGELLEEPPPAKVEKVEPVVAKEPPVVTPPPPPPASPVCSPVAPASPPVSRPRTPDPMAVLSPADAELAALLNGAPPQQHDDVPTSSETPPRCPTPDPLSVLSPEQALLASLLDGGALGDGGSGEVPCREPAPPTGKVPNWKRNGSPGILREEGGVKAWMRKLNL
jgi:hypothetical protein